MEFILAFAVPGMLLQLNGAVLDHATRAVDALSSWPPSYLHEQYLSGNFLWLPAEISNIPVRIVLIIRWSNVDKPEARSMDELRDEETDELPRAGLSGESL